MLKVCSAIGLINKNMAITKEQKRTILKNLQEKIAKSKSIVFTKFEGLGVKENEELRKRLRDENSEYYVAKKTLLDLAFRDSKIEGLDIKNFEGRASVVFGYEDEVAPAKIISNFKKDFSVDKGEQKIDFLGGILENKYINSQEVDDLSKIPGKQELYAKIVGSINAPVSGFVNVLAGNIRNFVNVLKALEEKKS